MNDYVSLIRIIKEAKPNEIYNLAAQSHVAVSFEMPEYTANADALGVLRILEAIKNSGFKNKIKFYQASTSELYGNQNSLKNQNESTPFYPASPYGVAKLYGYWITKIIENHIISMLPMEFYLIMNHQEEVKLL